MCRTILFILFCFSFLNVLRCEYSVDVISNGQSSGTVAVFADGRTGPYTVTINGQSQEISAGSISTVFNDVLHGSYVAYIENTYGCSVEIPFELSKCAIDVSFYLEGAFDNAVNKMRPDLFTLGLLPGQTPANALVDGTPQGQPYNVIPWNYDGDEGAAWTDNIYESYEDSPIDWALISILKEADNTIVYEKVGIVDDYGNFHFTCPDDLRDIIGIGAQNDFRIKVEHRNHLGIMSPNPHHFTSVSHVINMDFRTQDSYTTFSSMGQKTSSGQKESGTGFWFMFASDVDQSDYPYGDIMGSDKILWQNDNGIFYYYINTDFDLSGDVNGVDKILWKQNNGISSRVPKN